MRKIVLELLLGILILFVVTISLPAQNSDSTAASAAVTDVRQVPHLIRFAGTIRSADRTPRSGVVGVMFSLYSEQQGGVALWTELQNVTLDASGEYAVLLGSQHAEGVPAELFTSNEARWMGIQVEAEPEQPRILLVSVPYALKAGDAETVGGHAVSDFVLTPSAAAAGTAGTAGNSSTTNSSAGVTTFALNTGSSGGTANYIARWTPDGATLGNALLYDTGTAVGLGTTTPVALLEVDDTNAGGGLLLKGPSGDTANLRFRDPGASPSDFNIDYAGGALRYFTETGTNSGGVLRMVINSTTGNVGIGTSSSTPGTKLEVNGSIRMLSPAGTTFSASSTGFMFFAGNSDYKIGFDSKAGTVGYIRYNVDVPDAIHGHVFSAGTSGSYNDLMVVRGDGNVGIGTSTPTQKLTVAGAIQSTSGGFKFPDGSVQTTAVGVIAGGAGITGVTGTNGITSTNTNGAITLSSDFNVAQKRVASTCTTTQAIRSVDSAGGTTCIDVPGATSVVPTGFSVLGSSPLAPAGYSYVNWTPLGGNTPWSTKTAIPTARWGAAQGFYSASSIYWVVGGYTGSAVTNVTEYNYPDPSSTWYSWSSGGGPPTARAYAAYAAVGTDLYIIGGSIASGQTSVNEKLNMYSGGWTVTGLNNMGGSYAARTGACAVSIGTDIYVFGGYSGTTYLGDMHVYHTSGTASNSWDVKAGQMTTPRYNFTCFISGGKIYAYGGRTGASTVTNKLEVYDPATDTWTAKTSGPFSLTGTAAVVLNDGTQDLIYFFGGESSSGSRYSYVEVYVPALDEWHYNIVPSMPTARSFASAFTGGGDMWIVGGSTGATTATSINEKFDPGSLMYVYKKN